MRTYVPVAGALLASMGSVAACQSLPNTCDVEQSCPAQDASTTTTDVASVPENEAGSVFADVGGMTEGDAGAVRDAAAAPAADAATAAAAIDSGGAIADASPDERHGFEGSACPAGADPKDQPCVIDDALGVFVSPKGQTNGVGTKAAPLKSIDAAITLAKAAAGVGMAKRVYACGGTYDETVTVDATRDGVAVFGGLRCSDWTYTAERTALAPSAQGIALTLTSLTSGLFADLEIDARSAPATPPATASAAGASSTAVVANVSSGLEFRRVTIVAGNGQPGAAGGLAPFTFPMTTDLLGNAPSRAAGGAAKQSACLGGLTTTGGKGGDAPVGPGDPGLPALGGGVGGSTVQCTLGQGGFPGAAAGTAANGAGAATVGTLMAGGIWRPSGGAAGDNGAPGQGGGGGGAVRHSGGGSGGAGGCGGAGGGGGGGGGASAAVIAFGSGLAFTDSTLVGATGGNGGSGAAGQPGQARGGNGGVPDSTDGCQGGGGGGGGAGGAGGGGAGGISVGVLFQGAVPTLDGMTTARYVSGQPGSKGAGGSAVPNDGVGGSSSVSLAAR